MIIFQDMMMMMNMMMNMMKKDTYIRCSLRLTLEQDIYHIQRTLLTIEMIIQMAFIKHKIQKGQRTIDNY